MLQELLLPEVQQYIQQHLDCKIQDLAFKKSPFKELSNTLIINQIACKQKAKNKLPLWFKTPGIIYFTTLSIEQTSSEALAKYKADLIEPNTRLIDLTGGFGIDTYYFAQKASQVTHCELQDSLSQIAHHNFNALQANNITTIVGDSLTYLNQDNQHWDYIFVDPYRRDDNKNKVFLLSDCAPNVVQHLDFLLSKANTILIKTSPVLDITAGYNELKNVKQVHCVAHLGEVKELLWVIEKNYQGPIELFAANILKQTTQVYKSIFLQQANPTYATRVQQYLYEPNAAVLKTGAFDKICMDFDVHKLHKHSHLYTSDKIVDFPGRAFKVVAVYPYDKAHAKQFLSQSQANVTTRNFPLKVEQIRKKWKIKDGGDNYLFFTTLIDEQKVFIVTQKTTSPTL